MKRILLVMISLLFFGITHAHPVHSNTTISQKVSVALKPVNINTADTQQLMTLKGIGPKKAEAIIANRKEQGLFHSVDDLSRIKGFGKPFLDRLIKSNPGRVFAK